MVLPDADAAQVEPSAPAPKAPTEAHGAGRAEAAAPSSPGRVTARPPSDPTHP